MEMKDIMGMKITERIIGRAKLSPAEAKAVRFHFSLPTAGERTANWVLRLEHKKYLQFFESAMEKIGAVLKTKGAKR